MQSLHKCVYFLSIVFFMFYMAFYSASFDAPLSFDRYLRRSQKDSKPIRIALWTGNLVDAAKNWSNKGKLGQVQRYATEMNKGQNSVCRDIQLDEKDVYNFADDNDDELGHCEFFMTYKEEKVVDADAIAFVMYNTGFKLSELPQISHRKPEQIWVTEIRESPSMSSWRDSLQNVINWTMTYRRDSDIWSPYAKIVKRSEIIEAEDLKFIGNVHLDEWISGKSELIFGVISHCTTDSLREQLITQMNETGIRVDLFGGCGEPTCGRWANCTDFWQKFAKEYKFFMAFENSLCTEYITEKFWRALELGIVPVTYGDGNYQLEAPPDSYINARDFSSAQDLMKYLKHLDENSDAYAKYFQWRSKYKLQKDWETMHDNWCSLCKAVKRYKREGMQVRKTYRDLKFWWKHQPHSNKSACISKPRNFFTR